MPAVWQERCVLPSHLLMARSHLCAVPIRLAGERAAMTVCTLEMHD